MYMQEKIDYYESIESSFYSSHKFFIEYHKYTDTSSMANNHYHKAYEIYYMLEGERYYFIKDRTYHVMKGDIVLISRNEVHKTFFSKGSVNAERMLINFEPSFVEAYSNNTSDINFFECFQETIPVMRLKVSEQKYVENLLYGMKEETENTESGHLSLIKLRLLELLIFLSRNIKRVEENYKHPSSVHKKVSDMVIFINNNYSQEITLGGISKKYHISMYHLSRIFKQVTGFTFIEYLNLVRVRAAQKYLAETTMKVSQIAENVGFESITHFGRTFKSITGLAPLHYRKKNRSFT